MTGGLFAPLTLRGVTFKNRIFLSPMDQYSAKDGVPNAWHMTHYGARAVGGAACLIQEVTAVLPEGRISSGDLGLWDDEQAEAFRPLTQFIKEQGCVPGIQIGHAGRKGSTSVPWKGTGYVSPSHGGWNVVAPSDVPFDPQSPTPHALSEDEIGAVVAAFAKTVERCVVAGYEVVELHAAHGYLMHEFLSPLTNRRTDRYGGSLENRMRLVLEVAEAARRILPDRLPLFVRISATDWAGEGGWNVEQSVVLCKKLKDIGVDFIDVSTGGLIPDAKIPTGPRYQVPFAEAIKEGVQMPVGTVGQITEAVQAEKIISSRQTDVVLIGRAMLRDPYWPLHAAQALGEKMEAPNQYKRG